MKWPRWREITTSKYISEMSLALAVSKELNSKKAILLRNGRADSYSVEAMSKISTMTLPFLMSYFHLRQRLRHQKRLTHAV